MNNCDPLNEVTTRYKYPEPLMNEQYAGNACARVCGRAVQTVDARARAVCAQSEK